MALSPGRPLRVVIVDEELPYPMTSGKRIRTLNLVRRLARHHRITYLAHRNADEAEAHTAAEHLRDHGIEVVVVPRAVPAKRGLGFAARLAANLFSPLPYSVASHASRELREAVRRHAAENPVDLWQSEWTPYAEVLRGLRGARRVVMAHNIESQIWQRYRETETHPLKRWYIGLQWQKFRRFERAVFAESTRVVTVSRPDAELARSGFGAGRVSVVDNGVDTAYFAPDGTPRDPKHVLFLGSLDWRPNQDAVRLLAADVFPRVLAAEPAARLTVAGRNPPEWMAKLLRGVPHVELAANLPDVRPLLRGCGVMAVPLRVGGGSRLKILESLSSGLPVVSTTVGAEGLDLQPGRDLAIADGEEAFAAELVRHIRNPQMARQTAEQGRQAVLAAYDWGPLADRLGAIWEECAAGTSELAAAGAEAAPTC